MNRRLLLKGLFFVPAVFFTLESFGQNTPVIPVRTDTVILDIGVAEQRLVSQSLLLLAQKYNVDIAKSEVTQAKAWYNPNIVYTQSLYDPVSGSWLDNSSATGQTDVQIHQLFSIAGRHINAVRLAQIEVQQNQLSFDDLSRALKFEMYDDIANLFEAQQTDQLFTTELAALDQVIAAYQQELKLGAAAGNDVIRLKAEKQTTITDRLANFYVIEELESQIKILLGFKENTWIKIIQVPLPSGNVPLLDTLFQLSMKRPDVQLASTDVQWNQQNLKLQKSIGAPDLVLGSEYDHRNSYVNNWWSINAGIDIPIFNRNQGNVRAAKFEVTQSQYFDSLQIQTAKSEVVSAYGQFVRIRQVRDSVNAEPGVISGNGLDDKGSYSQDLDVLFHNAITNFSQRRISLIEFLDQLRTYEDARKSLITLDSDYFLAAQQLNYVTGTIVIL
jgi:cobalt-zinc-cadmium efflux system outer membrane protein